MAKTRVRGIVVLAGVLGIFGTSSWVEAQSCVPDCRQGYVCHQGSCVSACNPPCANGERCTEDVVCVAEAEQPAASDEAQLLREKSDLEATMLRVTAPAVLLGVGGVMLIAGGAVFATSRTDSGYGAGDWAGGLLMTVGGILVVASTPWLAVRVSKRQKQKRRIKAIDRQLAIAPILSLGAANSRYGLQLRGTF